MATVLDIVKAAARRLSIPVPTALVAGTDPDVLQLLECLREAGEVIRSAYDWPETRREYTFTLADGTASYALPADFDALIPDTSWNRNDYWPVIGPLSPSEWQTRKSGLIAASIRDRFTIKGWSSTQLFLDPTPDSDDADKVCVFEYKSSTWLRPTTVWSAALDVSAISYVYYGGNVYSKVSGSTTGDTAPTHISGDVLDHATSGVTWRFAAYDDVLVDTDVVLLDKEALIQGVVWRWKRNKGLDYGDLRRDAEGGLAALFAGKAGASTIDLCDEGGPLYGGPWNIPDGSWDMS